MEDFDLILGLCANYLPRGLDFLGSQGIGIFFGSYESSDLDGVKMLALGLEALIIH